MTYKNTKTGFGLIARLLHWGMALGIFALFGLGYWMRTLTYASPYYQSAPNLHQSVGMIVFALLLFRLIWTLGNVAPDTSDLTRTEHIGATVMHWVFYAVLFVMMAAGYFILTLDGRSFGLFDLIDIPSLYSQKGLEKLAGKIHWMLAYLTMALAALHSAAAIWHHFIKRDRVMIRMLKGPKTQNFKT